MMKNNNPSIIPRNHRVEEALEAAVTSGDSSVMEKLLEALANPYAYSADQEDYCAPPAPTNRPYRTFVGLDYVILLERCILIIRCTFQNNLITFPALTYMLKLKK